jgi:hypothetical protein
MDEDLRSWNFSWRGKEDFIEKDLKRWWFCGRKEEIRFDNLSIVPEKKKELEKCGGRGR